MQGWGRGHRVSNKAKKTLSPPLPHACTTCCCLWLQSSCCLPSIPFAPLSCPRHVPPFPPPPLPLPPPWFTPPAPPLSPSAAAVPLLLLAPFPVSSISVPHPSPSPQCERTHLRLLCLILLPPACHLLLLAPYPLCPAILPPARSSLSSAPFPPSLPSENPHLRLLCLLLLPPARLLLLLALCQQVFVVFFLLIKPAQATNTSKQWIDWRPQAMLPICRGEYSGFPAIVIRLSTPFTCNRPTPTLSPLPLLKQAPPRPQTLLA